MATSGGPASQELRAPPTLQSTFVCTKCKRELRCKRDLEKHRQMGRACRVKASRKCSRPKCDMGDDNDLSMNLGGPSAPERDGDVREVHV